VSSFLIATYRDETALDLLQNLDALFVRTTRYQFLAKVIPIRICHRLGQTAAQLLEHEIYVGLVCPIQLFLHESRPSLSAHKSSQMSLKNLRSGLSRYL
jgi:hypothetical protein